MHKNIKNVSKNNFRTDVYLEDVIRFSEILVIPVEVGDVIVDEEVGVFTDWPMQYPNIGKFYKSRVTGVEDRKIEDIVWSLQHINGVMNSFSVKKMVEFIVGYLTYVDKEGKPVVSFEQMYPVVVNAMNRTKVDHLSMVEKSVFFSVNSRLTTSQKKSFVNRFLFEMMNKHITLGIHNAALIAIAETYDKVKITDPKVLKVVNKRKSSANDAIQTVRVLKRHMAPRTAEMLKEANIDRVFLSDKVGEKYLEFLKDPEESLNSAAKRLGVSKSTVVEFREIFEKENN